MEFLRDNDFQPAPGRPDGWFIAEEISLHVLDDSEIVAKERIA